MGFFAALVPSELHSNTIHWFSIDNDFHRTKDGLDFRSDRDNLSRLITPNMSQ